MVLCLLVCVLWTTPTGHNTPHGLRADEMETGALKVFNYYAWVGGSTTMIPNNDTSLHYSRAVGSWTPSMPSVAA
jgi:hypothetical protein